MPGGVGAVLGAAIVARLIEDPLRVRREAREGDGPRAAGDDRAAIGEGHRGPVEVDDLEVGLGVFDRIIADDIAGEGHELAIGREGRIGHLREAVEEARNGRPRLGVGEAEGEVEIVVDRMGAVRREAEINGRARVRGHLEHAGAGRRQIDGAPGAGGRAVLLEDGGDGAAVLAHGVAGDTALVVAARLPGRHRTIVVGRGRGAELIGRTGVEDHRRGRAPRGDLHELSGVDRPVVDGAAQAALRDGPRLVHDLVGRAGGEALHVERQGLSGVALGERGPELGRDGGPARGVGGDVEGHVDRVLVEVNEVRVAGGAALPHDLGGQEAAREHRGILRVEQGAGGVAVGRGEGGLVGSREPRRVGRVVQDHRDHGVGSDTIIRRRQVAFAAERATRREDPLTVDEAELEAVERPIGVHRRRGRVLEGGGGGELLGAGHAIDDVERASARRDGERHDLAVVVEEALVPRVGGPSRAAAARRVRRAPLARPGLRRRARVPRAGAAGVARDHEGETQGAGEE